MKTETLAGTLVLIHPQLENDPAGKQGQVGVLTYAAALNENYVSFPKGGEAIYEAENLMLLKPLEQVKKGLQELGRQMPDRDFRAMFKIMMRQEMGASSDLVKALELAAAHPAIWDITLEALNRSEKIELANTLQR